MKILELIEFLSRFDPDTQIVLQKDAEGNGYSPLAGADECIYVPENTWSGDVYDLSWTAEDCCMDLDEHAELMSKPHAIVLFPVN